MANRLYLGWTACSEALELSMETMREKIVEAARREIGTPFLHQGRQAGKGLDCIGIMCVACEYAGYPTHAREFKAYSREPDGVTLLQEMDRAFDRVDKRDLQPGDCAAFRIGRHVRHLGIITPGPNKQLRMVHVRNDMGRAAEHDLDKSWMKRLHDWGYTMRGVAPWQF